MNPSTPELEALLASADASEHGLEVDVTSPERLRTKLYAVRKSLGMDHLSFALSPDDPVNKLWIVKNGK